jgi:cytochrome c biogenesis protein CcmG/thiol:disulfide interchange protein DsbE
MKLNHWLPLLVFVFVSGFLFKGLYLDPKKLPSTYIGKQIPKFSLSGISTEHGLSSADFHKQWSVLNVWATWCLACRDDHKFLMELAATDFPIYGLDYKDDKVQAVSWLESLGNPYRAIGFDKLGNVAIDFGVYGTPETFLVDKYGVIRYRHVGVLNKSIWQEKFLPIIRGTQES